MYLIEAILILVASVVLIKMMISDWRYRHIQTLHLVVFGVSINVWGIISSNFEVWKFQLMTNELVVVIYLAVILFYLVIKKLPLRLVFKNYFGLGDLLYLVFLAPMFAPRDWLAVTISSFVVAIVLHLVFSRNTNMSVPFITYSGFVVFLAFVFVVLKRSHGIT